MKTKLFFIGRLVLLLWCGLVPTFLFSQQIPNSLIAANGTFIGFYEYKPVDYAANPTKKYPIIIFLHGMGERGNGTSQLPMVLANAIPKYINAGHTMTFTYNGQTETFLVLSPQLSASYGHWPSFYTAEMIKYAKNNLRIDTNRIYLTGVSLGGGGTWRYASESYENARQLAAIAPVCGTCDWGNVCSSIAAAGLPVWAFHAQDDGLVGVGCTTGAISMINSCNPTVPAIMSIYPMGNHWIWDQSYDTAHVWHNPNMYEWFLSHSRSTSANGPNIPPVARAGNDQTITLPVNAVTLNGNMSSDADGTITAYNWVKLAGPSQYSITSSAGVSTTVNNLAPGLYSFQLTVTDNRGATAMDTVLVTVNGAVPTPNQPPIALAGADQAMTLPTNNTYLFGSASYDPDGVISSYTWSQVSGPSTASINILSASNVNVSNLTAGTYAFRLLVTDNIGAADDDTLLVTVHSPNIPPTANAGNDQSIQLPTNSVTLNASASSDPDGSISSYAWTKISGPAQYNIANANSVNASVTSLAAGSYLFRLVVTDNAGATDDDTVVINVAPAPPPPNVPPVANAGIDQSIQLPTNNVTLDGSASADADGNISSYTWSKIAGPAQYNISNANGISTSVTNLTEGTYVFRLVIADNNGATDDDTVIITVTSAPPPPNVPPTSNAGADQSIQLPGNSVILDGAASSDPDGTIITYAWSKIAGPAQYNIASANNISTTVTNLTAGTYLFMLVVTDNSGATDSDTVSINVSTAPPPPNVPPVANAGNDQSIQLPINTVTLDGSASTDADGTILTYAWSKLTGPGQFNIANAAGASTAVTNLTEGTYSFRLVITDNNGATDDDTVIITVTPAPPPPNVPPTSNAGADQSIQLPTNSVMLNGSASSDADGTIASYAWSKIAGPAQYNITNAGSINTTVTGLTTGTYSFRLVVTDNDGANDDDTVVITVLPAPPPPNLAPTANAGSDQSVQFPVNSVSLDGSGSTDADGNITSYAWSKISGPAQYNLVNATNVSTVITGLTSGTYLFRLVVTDNDGATDDDTVMITVTSPPPPPNVPPVANAGSDHTIQLPANSVTLDGSSSTDADGSITTYVWSKITGPAQYNINNAGNVSTPVTNLTAGSYTFRLQVTDNNGAMDDDTVNITVLPAPPPPNQLPVAKAGNDTIVYLPSSAATLNGSASYDPDGSIVSYSWNRISGPAGITIVNATTSIADVVGMAAGDYIFELTVTDNDGATSTDQVKITVITIPNLPPIAKAGRDTSIAVPASTGWLTGMASKDPDGNIIRYKWRQIAGPSFSRIQYVNAPATMVNSLQVGDYIFELEVTDDKGATATDSVMISIVNNFRYEEMLIIYPNPVVAKATVRCVSDSTGELSLRIIDLHGKFVKSMQTFKGQSDFQQNIMLNDLKPGVYYLEALIGKQKRMIKKFIKQ